MLRIATIGTSAITENLIEVLDAHPRAAFVGTLSRDRARADAFTAAHGGTRGFTDLAELAASEEVDAVYIASPNACHAKQALACIAGGKHVLVEKPFAATRAEAERVLAAAREAGVVALEAMRPLHDPAFHQMRDLLGRIGRLRRATIRFGKYSSRYDDILAGRRTNIFDCALASGALMDMGVYTVEPAFALLGEPASIAFAPNLLDEETRSLTGGPIDGAGTLLLGYPGLTATLAYSKITMDYAPCQFEGEEGTLELDSISLPSRAVLRARGAVVRGDAKDSRAHAASEEVFELPHVDNTMAYELDDFICAIEAVRAGACAHEAPCGPFGTTDRFASCTLGALAIMDAARAQAGIAFPADRA